MLKDLTSRGLWNSEMKNQLIAAQGSVQGLDIPQDLKDIYKTVCHSTLAEPTCRIVPLCQSSTSSQGYGTTHYHLWAEPMPCLCSP